MSKFSITDYHAKRIELPDTPGIYLFYNKNAEIIYVGKATSLKSRVRSYFTGRSTPRPIEEMIHEVCFLEYKNTDSPLEAIIAEALHIKKLLPKYNVLGKDDKSWNYIGITRAAYPQVLTIREHDVTVLKRLDPNALKQYRWLFGPYPGLNAKATMKILRRLFLFSDCQPGQGRPCLYRQMGQCLGVCTGDISPAAYQERVVRPLRLFLEGRKKRLIKELEKQMRSASTAERFEEAAQFRNQLYALQRIQDVTILNESFFSDSGFSATPSEPVRIEGYDISNLGATDKVGSMVVFDAEGPIKSEYRKFTIRTVPGQSDVDCLAEVIDRRLRHTEWPLPDLFLIDGGKPQVNRVAAILGAAAIATPVVGIAKGPKRKRNDIVIGVASAEQVAWIDTHRPLLVRVRDEAHRFAITFNRSKRKII